MKGIRRLLGPCLGAPATENGRDDKAPAALLSPPHAADALCHVPSLKQIAAAAALKSSQAEVQALACQLEQARKELAARHAQHARDIAARDAHAAQLASRCQTLQWQLQATSSAYMGAKHAQFYQLQLAALAAARWNHEAAGVAASERARADALSAQLAAMRKEAEAAATNPPLIVAPALGQQSSISPPSTPASSDSILTVITDGGSPAASSSPTSTQAAIYASTSSRRTPSSTPCRTPRT